MAVDDSRVRGSRLEIENRIRSVYSAYNDRDWDALVALMDPEYEWDVVEEIEAIRGPAAVIEYFERWLAPWEEFRVEADDVEIAPAGDRALIAVRCWGKNRRSRVAIEERFFHVLTVRNGRLWRGREFMDEADARRAFEAADPRSITPNAPAPGGRTDYSK